MVPPQMAMLARLFRFPLGRGRGQAGMQGPQPPATWSLCSSLVQSQVQSQVRSICCDLAQDQMQDLVEAQMDLAVRAGPNADSSLMTRTLGTFHWLFVASPDYIARAGTPMTPADLHQHDCIVRTPSQVHGHWHFTVDGEEQAVAVRGAVSVNESAVARRAALAGLGIARLDELHVHDDLQSGALVQVLAAYPTAPVPLYLVYPSRRNLARRTRVVMEFLVAQAALGPRRAG